MMLGGVGQGKMLKGDMCEVRTEVGKGRKGVCVVEEGTEGTMTLSTAATEKRAVRVQRNSPTR